MFRKLTVSLSIITGTYAAQSGSLTPKREWSQAELDNHHEMLKKLASGNVFEDVLGGYINHEPYAKMLDVHNRRERIRARKLQAESESNLRGNRKLVEEECDPNEVVLEDSPQWAAEKGYWEGELSFYKEDGTPYTSKSWPYQYDHYKGFITSSVNGNTYKQRNIFMYPALGHQPIADELYDNVEATKAAKYAAYAKASGKTRAEKREARQAYREAKKALNRELRKNLRRGQRACAARLADDFWATMTVGDGECGINGNTKVFQAEQSTQTCSNNPELAGDIEGPYGSLSYTYTQLVGQDNALLYQIYITASALNFFQGEVLGNPNGLCTQVNPSTWDCGYTEDRLMQSQLTTLTEVANFDGSTTQRRTRTAQGFDVFTPGKVGTPTYASFYREVKVAPEEASSVALATSTTPAPPAEPEAPGGDFYPDMSHVQHAYNIHASDMGAHKSGETGGTLDSGLEGEGFPRVMSFLEQAFVHPEPETTTTAAPAEP